MQRSWIYMKDTTSGAALAGVAISFFSPGTNVPVTLYDPSSSLDTPTVAIANPVITDAEGYASWAIPDGDYDVMFQGGSLTQRTIRRVNFFDSSTFTLGGGGSVTSVALSLPAELTVAGSPVTTNGTLAVSWASGTGTAAQGKFIGTPAGGGAGAYAPRVLVNGDLPALIAANIPNLDAAIITTGTLPTTRGGTGETLTAIKVVPVQWSLPVKVVQVVNINVANPGTATFDSVAITSGQRMLLQNQTAPAENGIWVFNGAASPLTRPEDYKSGSTTAAYEDRTVYVISGSVYSGSIWRISTTGAITIDTTSVTFTQMILRSTGGTNSQVVYQTTTGYATSANLTFDGTNLGMGSTTPATATTGMIWYDATQQRFMGSVGTTPANFKTYIPGTFASGTGGTTNAAPQVSTLTLLLGSQTIPADTLKVGSIIKFRQYIQASGLTATPGFAFFINTSVVTCALAATVTVNTIFIVDAIATVKTIGASGTMDVQIAVQSATNTTGVSFIAGNTASVAINTTVTRAIDHKITLTGVSAGSVNFFGWTMDLIA